MAISIDSKEVEKNLQDFLENTLPQALEQGLEKACLLIEGDAKNRCPVRDGQLRNSINHKVESNQGVIGSNVEYAPYVEVGTGIYSTEGGGRQTPWTYQDSKGDWHTTKGMTAQPFLRPAAEANRSGIIECFKGLID